MLVWKAKLKGEADGEEDQEAGSKGGAALVDRQEDDQTCKAAQDRCAEELRRST